MEFTKTEKELFKTTNPVDELIDYNMKKHDYHIKRAEYFLERAKNIRNKSDSFQGKDAVGGKN